MKKIFSLIILLLATACIGTPAHTFPSKIYIDDSFTDHERDIIEKSVYEWRDATDGIADEMVGLIDSDTGQRDTIRPINSKDPRIVTRDRSGVQRLGKLHLFTLGFAYMGTKLGPFEVESSGNIYLVIDRIRKSKDPDKKLRHIVLHELGHHYGIQHLPEGSNTVMEPYGNVGCITILDLKAFCGLYECFGRNVKSSCL